MKTPLFLLAAILVSTLGLAGCERHKGPVDATKDALDMREHEKLKDAGEDARDAARNAAQGMRDETR